MKKIQKSESSTERDKEVLRVHNGWIYYKDGTRKRIEDEPELAKCLNLEK